jgi:hypothetical protein
LIDVTAERLLFVLGQDVDSAQARVEAVREGYVDDPVDAAKRYRRFTTIARERIEPLSGSSG